MTPSDQLKHKITETLQTAATSWEPAMRAGQIRCTLDLSGEPKDTSGIAVSVSDMGGYNGMPSRVLITCDARVRVFTHLESDLDGTQCETFASLAMDTLSTASFTLDGWMINGTSGWKIADAAINGSFRVMELSATFYIQQYTSSSSISSTETGE